MSSDPWIKFKYPRLRGPFRPLHMMDDNKEFVEDILKMIQRGSLNDVKIRLSDGEIVANKDILMARSEYFKTMFNNNKFIESQTSCVDMRHCSKVIMDKIVNYFFSGKMKINELTLAQLLKLTSMLGMLMLDKQMKRTSDFIITCVVPDSGVNCAFLPELISGLVLADQLGLIGPIMNALVEEIVASLKDIPQIPEVVINSEVFKTLPFELVELILNPDWLCHNVANKKTSTTKQRFDAFAFWMSGNEVSDEDKKEIVKCFHFEDFTAEELLTSVRDSGLYSVKKIDKRVLDLIRRKDKFLEEKERRLEEAKEESMLNDQIISDLHDDIAIIQFESQEREDKCKCRKKKRKTCPHPCPWTSGGVWPCCGSPNS